MSRVEGGTLEVRDAASTLSWRATGALLILKGSAGMRVFMKWLSRILIVLGLAIIAVGIWKREEIGRLLAVNSLFSEDKIVENFSSMNTMFLTRDVPRGSNDASHLPKGPEVELPSQTTAWIRDRSVTSLLVLHEGQIVHESYHLGTEPGDRRISWSVAKSFLSALVGILIDEGAIGSLDDPVTKYAPELRGSAYDGTRLRDVLNMASGVTFDEDYLDFNSDINRMGRVLALWDDGRICRRSDRDVRGARPDLAICLDRHACHRHGRARRHRSGCATALVRKGYRATGARSYTLLHHRW